VLCALNSKIRRERRRAATLLVMAGLAGAVFATHGAMNHDHAGDFGDVVVICVAVAETAAVALVLTFASGPSRSTWSGAALLGPEPLLVRSSPDPRARAGPIPAVLRL
jgi:hypothetical protein